MINIETDLHVHTVASGHAYNTVSELATCASACGLEAIAITDHGPGLPGGPHRFHFMNQKRFKKMSEDCLVFSGVEEDLLDCNGNVYLEDEILQRLDVVLLGSHPYGWAAESTDLQITDSILKAMQNPLIKGIAHPVNAWYKIDVKELAKIAKSSHTALEFNLSKVYGLEAELVQLLEWVIEFEAPLIINSDAHIVDELGDYSSLPPFEELIQNANLINSSLAKTQEFFNIKP